MSRTLRCFWHLTRQISLPALRCRSTAERLSTSIEQPGCAIAYALATWEVPQREDRVRVSPLLQPSSACFQGIYLPHNFVGKNDVFALLWREISVSVIAVKQDHRSIIRKSRFSLGGKITEDQTVRIVFFSFGFN
jgi:hypothetical protein